MYDLQGWEPLGGTFTCEACKRPIDKEAEDTILVKSEIEAIYKFHNDCILQLNCESKEKEGKLK